MGLFSLTSALKRSVSCLILFSSLAAFSQVHDTMLTVGYDQTPPFHYKNRQGKVIGTDVDLIREVVTRMGFSARFLERPWLRTINELEEGRLDVAIGAKYTPERAVFAYYSVSYKSIEHWLYCKTGTNEAISSISAFFEKPGLVLGVVRGWGYPPEIAKHILEDKNRPFILQVNHVHQLPYLLEAGRVDGIILTPAMLKEVEKTEDKKFDFTKRAGYYENLHFLLSKKSVPPAIFNKFNDTLSRLLEEGARERINRHYQ